MNLANSLFEHPILKYLDDLNEEGITKRKELAYSNEEIDDFFDENLECLAIIESKIIHLLKNGADALGMLHIISRAPKFTNNLIIDFLFKFLNDKIPTKKQYAARSLLMQMNYDNKHFRSDVFTKILYIAFFNESNEVRECILKSFPAESHRWLSDNNTVMNLVSLINDPAENIRAAALNLLISVTKLNPFLVLPQLRHALLNDIYIFNSRNQTFRFKAQRAESFSLLLQAALPILPAYSHIVCDTILRMLSLQKDGPEEEDEVEKLKIILAQTIRSLANVTPIVIEAHVTQFIGFLINILPHTTSLELSLEIIKTLYALFTQSKTVFEVNCIQDEELLHMFSYLTLIATKYKNEELTVEVFKLMGCVGALEQSGVVQNEEEQTTDDEMTHEKEKFFWSTICNLLTGIISNEKDPSINSLAVSAIVHIFCDTMLDTSVFEEFMITFVGKIEKEKGNYYLDQLTVLCINIPYSCQRFGLDIMEVIKKIWDNQDTNVQKQITQLIPILVNSLPDDLAESIPCIIQFSINNMEKAAHEKELSRETKELVFCSISTLLRIRSHADDFIFIIIPEFISIASRTKDEEIVVSIINGLTLFIELSNSSSSFAVQIVQLCLSLSRGASPKLLLSIKEVLYAISIKIGEDAMRRFNTPIIIQALNEKRKYKHIPHSRTNSAIIHKAPVKFCEEKLIEGFSGEEIFSKKHILLTIQLSPFLYVTECSIIASRVPNFDVKLFCIAFVSCWEAVSEEGKKSILSFLIRSLKDKNETPENLSILCSLFEFMEKWEIELDSDTCRIISEISLNSWHLAKAIYFAHRALYRRKGKRTGDIDWLISLSAKMGLDQTVNGLLLLMKKEDSSPTCFEQLGMWKEAQKLYQKDSDPNKKFVGNIKCSFHQLHYNEILTKKNFDYLFNNQETAKASLNFAFAMVESGKFAPEKIEKIISLFPKDSIRGLIIQAIYNICIGQSKKALCNVEDGYKILASRLNDKDVVYPLLIKAQELHEVSEIARDVNGLNEIWEMRLSRCRKTFEIYHKIISIRLQKFPVESMIHDISKMLELALQSNRLEAFDRTISQLFPERTKYPVEIRFVTAQRIWAEGEKKTAIKALISLLKSDLIEFPEQLRAKVNFTCGNWMLYLKQTDPSAPDINIAMSYLKEAINIDNSFYRAWHRWSWASSLMFFKSPKNTIHARNAVTGFLKCVKLKEGDSFSDLIQSIYLIFLPSIDEGTFMSITEAINDLDDKALLSVLPQLFSQLNRARPYVVEFVGKIITRLLTPHFHVVFYPLMFYQTDPLFNKLASDIKQLFTKRMPIAAAEGAIVHEGLIRCSQSIPEKWKEYIAMILHHLESKEISKAACLLEEASIIGSPPRDSTFMKNFRIQLATYANRLQQMTTCNESFINEIIQLYISIRKHIVTTRQLDVSKCAPRLASLHTTILAVPGTYTTTSPIIKIAQVDTKMLVYRSKQRPRNLTIIGSDGSVNKSLLKGSEDLRLDQRVMQFFDLINQHTQHDWANSNLKIFVYSITPLSKSAGLIQFVNGADTLFSLINEYRSERGRNIFQEKEMLTQLCGCSADSLLPIQRREALAEVMEKTDDTDLREILWQKSPSSREWVSRTTRFAQSSALMSIIGYMLGLGDRHPSNLMIHRYTGSVIHIDFSDCFEITKDRIKFPELVPFRLTRMMISAFGPAGIEGNFRLTCVKIVALVRAHRDSIVAVLEAKHAEDKDEACEPSSASAAGAGIISEPNIPDEMPSEDDWSFDQTNSPRAQNYDITGRLRDKIAGCDFSRKNLTPDEQVEELIESAIDPYNISFLYQGWTPLW